MRAFLSSTSMISLQIKQKLGIGVIAGGLLGIALTFGNLSTAANDVFRKVGQTIYPVPSTLSLDVASTTASSLKISETGSRLTDLLVANCNMTGMNVSQVATSSANYDCAVTGVQTNDFIFFGQATTVPTTFHGWRIMGANASSSNGYITFKVWNGTGADAIPSVSKVGSSTPVLILRKP